MTRSLLGLGAVLVVAAVAAAPAARAQEPAAALESAAAAYRDGRLLAAAREAEAALAAIREELAGALTGALPAPPEGWGGPEPRATGAEGAGAGLVVARTFESDGARLTAVIVVDPLAAEGVEALLAAPDAPLAPAGLERVEVDGRPGLLDWDDAAGQGRVVVPLGGGVLAQVTGRGLETAQSLRGLIEAWDLDAVAAALR